MSEDGAKLSARRAVPMTPPRPSPLAPPSDRVASCVRCFACRQRAPLHRVFDLEMQVLALGWRALTRDAGGAPVTWACRACSSAREARARRSPDVYRRLRRLL